MTQQTSSTIRPTVGSSLRQLVGLGRVMLTNRKYGKSPARDPHWILLDAPVRPCCVEDDPAASILTTETGLRFVRTPEEHFTNLPGYAFEPHYAMVEGLQMHYVDEGARDGANVAAWQAMGQFKKPFLFFGSEHDLNMGSRANQERLTQHIPGAHGQPHERFEAAHFIQEDIGEILAERMVRWMKA